ncbi:hypothetical protein EMIT0194MI4_30043 [Pseudomonas sp. IT-194MI4]
MLSRKEYTRSLARDFSSSRRAPPNAASKPYLSRACLRPSVFMMSVCLALPWVSGLIPCATPSGLTCTSRSRPSSSTMRSRNAYISLNFHWVSTCITGNGSLPGKNALRARCSITAESLPTEYSITGLSNSAATSRMMWMLSASSCFRCVSLSTMATHENDLMDGLRAVFERGILAQRPLLIRTAARSKGYMNIPPRLGSSPVVKSGSGNR